MTKLEKTYKNNYRPEIMKYAGFSRNLAANRSKVCFQILNDLRQNKLPKNLKSQFEKFMAVKFKTANDLDLREAWYNFSKNGYFVMNTESHKGIVILDFYPCSKINKQFNLVFWG